MAITYSPTETDDPMILCVDDEPAVVDAIGRTLHWYQLRVTKALHGMQGIWLSQVAKPDLVITDFKMPMCNGFELLSIVGRSVPVIVVTGVRDEALKEVLLATGAADVLFKPVDSRDLITAIGKFVQLKKRR